MDSLKNNAINMACGGHGVAYVAMKLEKTFGNNKLSRSQIYKIIKGVKDGDDMEDGRGKFIKNWVWTPKTIEAVMAFFETDRRCTHAEVELRFGFLVGPSTSSSMRTSAS